MGSQQTCRYPGRVSCFEPLPLISHPPHGGSEPFDESLRLKMGAETMEPLSPAQLRVWRAQLTPEAQALAGNLPVEEPLDLMDSTRRHFVSLWPRW